MPDEIKPTPNIALQDIVAAAAEGAIRALGARKIGAGDLIKSGFAVEFRIRAGGIPVFLSPQPLPPSPSPER
jgi:hypothetical protein